MTLVTKKLLIPLAFSVTKTLCWRFIIFV